MKNNWKDEFKQKFLVKDTGFRSDDYYAISEEVTVEEIYNFITSLLAEQKKELMDEILKLVQEDIDFGAKYQQIVSTKAQSYLLTQLKNYE